MPLMEDVSAQLTGSEMMKIVIIGDLGQTIHSQVKTSWRGREGGRGEAREGRGRDRKVRRGRGGEETRREGRREEGEKEGEGRREALVTRWVLQHTMEKVESSLRASENSYAMSWIIGDLPYADGDGHRWDPWGRMMEPASARSIRLVLSRSSSP